jgi:hypothetical protein
MKRFYLIYLAAMFFFSCSGGGNAKFEGTPLQAPYSKFNGAEMAVNQESVAQNSPDKGLIVDKKRIIKDGRIGLKVSDLESAKKSIDTLLQHFDAYYDNENFTNSDYESAYELKVRVPAVNFEAFVMASTAGEGEILYKEINARDVTEEFIDLETRLSNKREYLKRYNELLRQAKTVKDILEIEEKTRQIEEEIESAEGRLKYLSDLVSYSTLDIRLSHANEFKFQPVNRANFFERLKQSLSKGWFGLIDFSLFLLKLWPFWLIVTMLIFFWKKLRTRIRKGINH